MPTLSVASSSPGPELQIYCALRKVIETKSRTNNNNRVLNCKKKQEFTQYSTLVISFIHRFEILNRLN